jgi:hypothetical protein
MTLRDEIEAMTQAGIAERQAIAEAQVAASVAALGDAVRAAAGLGLREVTRDQPGGAVVADRVALAMRAEGLEATVIHLPTAAATCQVRVRWPAEVTRG